MSSSLKDPAIDGTYFKVKPQDTSLHQAYTFYSRVSAYGGAEVYFGPYSLNVGCFSPVATYSDSSSLVTSKSFAVGDATSSAYTFEFPTHSLTWCTV